jgi:glycosyltransferase involved in cell wall biosynthesis
LTRRVLFLSGLQLFPTSSGGMLRTFALANALKHHGMEVFVYSLVGRKPDYLARRPSGIQVWPGGIEEYVRRDPLLAGAQFGSYAVRLPPLWITAYLGAAAASPGARLLPALLREKLLWCDAVVADFPWVYPVFGASCARGRLRVVNTHNIEHRFHDPRVRRRNAWVRPAVRRIELAAAEASDILVSCCAEDAAFFTANARVRKSIVVPNGANLERFRGIEAHRSATRRQLGVADDVRIFIFTGSKWGPNREAYQYLLDFATGHAAWLESERVHLLVVGDVVAEPFRRPGFTATGSVPTVEPYFAAADAALNPITSGAGTNVKMGEFIALRLPIVTTAFGARGFDIEDGVSGFLFEKQSLAPVLKSVRALFDEEPGRLRRIADLAFLRNESVVDMDACARGLARAMTAGLERPRSEETGGVRSRLG